jgi:hypothetical protein
VLEIHSRPKDPILITDRREYKGADINIKLGNNFEREHCV